ncbi:MAG: threonine/serine exporter family protein [Clostridiales bacterium]|nr:threonine/serine exporter family protein [Clostridiales bacterium]
MEYAENKGTMLLHQLLNLGEAMIASGAEVNRVEDTLTRLGTAYGAQRMDVFVITSSIVVTMIFPDGQEMTQTRRILKPGGTNFTRLEALNALSRDCCMDPMPVEELSEKLKELENAEKRKSFIYIGSMLAAGSFAVFFGGGLLEGIIAALFAIMICFLQYELTPFCPNKVVFNLLCSMLVGGSICLCAKLMPGLQADKVMIGDIMLLIPGLAMTNSIRDVLVGDTISGIMRLIESLLWAGSLACGFMIAIWLIGG